MDEERITALADALLICAKDNNFLVTTWNCGRARQLVTPKATHPEVLVATTLLLELNLVVATSEVDAYRLTDKGIAHSGNLAAYRKGLDVRADAEHAANLAAVDAVEVSREQVRLATIEAKKANRAMWWSIGAAIASALIALLTWLCPREV